MQGKHQSQTTERLLATGQVGDVLPRFLRRHHTEQDALGKRIERIDQLEFGIAAHGDHLVHLFETQGDGAEAFHEALEAELAQFVATLLGRVAPRHGLLEVGTARGVLFDPAAVFGEDAELDVDVLGLFFQDGYFALESLLVHVCELIGCVLR